MKKVIKFIYWFIMSILFLLMLWREKKISELNHINLEK